MKRILCVILIISAAVLCLSSCGHVADLDKLKKLAKQNGDCEYISCEEGEDYRTAYFKDELGFEYYIKSYMTDINIDGASFGSTPSIASDYTGKYISYVCSKTARENKNCKAKIYSGEAKGDLYFGDVTIVADTADLPDSVNTIGKAFMRNDLRKVYSESTIPVEDSNGNSIGSFGLEQMRYLDEVETRGDYYMECISQYYSLKNEKNDLKPVYSHYEHLAMNEVEGLSSKELDVYYNDTDPRTDGVDVYYFTVDGKEYFVTNASVRDANGGDVYFYNNYISDPYSK